MRRAGLVVVSIILLAGCGDWMRSGRIDEQWHRQSLVEGHLGPWLRASPTENGFFRSSVTRNWQATDGQPGDLVVQSRLVYAMAVGYDVTGDAAYLAQVRRGADFMLTNFRDPQYGGWFEAVNADGSMRNGNKRLYAQVFAMFALAHAHRVTHDPRYLDGAMDTWRDIQYRFADGSGGFRAGMNRDFSQTMIGNTQNPIMHLFEALLAIHEASGSAEALAAAGEVANFVVFRLVEGTTDGGARIPELYDVSWKPMGKGGYIDIGHQFEWAYLFSAGAERGLNPVLIGVAERLLKFAMAEGYDRREGGVFARIDSAGVVDRSKGYWQQAEALRALMHHAVLHQREDLWSGVTQLTEFVRQEFVDGEYGGWSSVAWSECRRRNCPDRQPDPYHMVAMHREALRLAALKR